MEETPVNLHDRMIEFWDSHADFFNEYTEKTLDNNGWVSERLNDLFPGANNLKIADIGTGAGFVAISVAQLGHEVTATDLSGKMLAFAKRNAESRGLAINFVSDDAEDTKLENNYFDIVILRDVLNGLINPRESIERILTIIRPGGYLVISDGNYFLHNHDEAYRRREEYFKLRDGRGEYGSMLDLSPKDYSELEKLAQHLESSYQHGPQWHIDFLLKMGMNNLRVRCDDPVEYHQYTETGKEKVPFRYSVISQKPHIAPIFKTVGRFDKTHQYSTPLGAPESIGKCFAALSDPSRVAILAQMLSGPMPVTDIATRAGLSVNKTSYHLNIMKDIGLVFSEKEGRTVRYSVSDEGSVEYLLHAISSIVSRN